MNSGLAEALATNRAGLGHAEGSERGDAMRNENALRHWPGRLVEVTDARHVIRVLCMM